MDKFEFLAKGLETLASSSWNLNKINERDAATQEATTAILNALKDVAHEVSSNVEEFMKRREAAGTKKAEEGGQATINFPGNKKEKEKSLSANGPANPGTKDSSDEADKVESVKEKKEDKVVIKSEGVTRTEHANGGESTVAVNTQLNKKVEVNPTVGSKKEDKSTVPTSPEPGASEKPVEQEASNSQKTAENEEAVVDAETSLNQEPTEGRAADIATAHTVVKDVFMEKAKKNFMEPQGKEREELMTLIQNTFPLDDVRSDPKKSGRKARGRLFAEIWKECVAAVKKQNIVPQKEIDNVLKTSDKILNTETDNKNSEKAEEKTEKKEEPAKTEAKDSKPAEEKKTIAPAKLPEKTKEISPDEIQTALELAAISDPEELTDSDLPAGEGNVLLKQAITNSFENATNIEDTLEGGSLNKKWVNHLKNRKDKSTENLRKVVVVGVPGSSEGKEVDTAQFYVNRIAEQIQILKAAS